MNYIQPRSDDFYYLEVWDKQKMRDSKLTDLLGGEKLKPEYVAGSQKRLDKVNKRYEAIFWKNRESVDHRIECLNNDIDIKNNYKFVIKCLTREEFIKEIPDSDGSNYLFIKRNQKLKTEELRYLDKLKMIN
jgi:hypothetical protein